MYFVISLLSNVAKDGINQEETSLTLPRPHLVTTSERLACGQGWFQHMVGVAEIILHCHHHCCPCSNSRGKRFQSSGMKGIFNEH